ncbi:glycoside hydrolase [Paenibacillus sp. HB172176]|uniref:glycoside hydrolase n=1 Tax=Paenibacillus sp. HB172176 TaxID=2493690 RepID=UPI001F0D6D02|nr:glycoside hydrolase [Paenibacillus sp. HB172176]
MNKIWKQAPFCDTLQVTKVIQQDHILNIELTRGLSTWHASLELTADCELSISLSSKATTKFDKLVFPNAFIPPDKEHYVLQTDSQGLLLPVDDDYYPLEEKPFFFAGGGAAMSWIGMTDTALESGYMAIFETPFDAAIRLGRENGFITFYPVWLPSMGQFGYTRKIRYIFFDQGGYVAQCKRYRAYIWPKNDVIRLKENQKRFPAIEKILGAPHIYVWDKARETRFVEELKAAGIDKALILWDPNHTPYPEPGFDNELKALGYATGAYELFSDIHPDAYPGNEEIKGMPLKRNVFPGMFDNLTARQIDGNCYSNEFGNYICPDAVRSEIVKRVDKELDIYPHETYFLDVYQSNGIYECHHPEHRLTRQQYAEAIIENYKLLENQYNLFLGGEFGADFTGSHGVYAHGMMTLQRTWFICKDTLTEGTIYYKGNWSSNPKPSIMLGTRTAHEDYLKYSINEYTRVPLYELVYHDAVVTSWRWEDCNHHCPEIWWKKDLFNMLYGTAPLWSLDQDRWDSFKASFLKSNHTVCDWLKQVCYDELVMHRFISDDHKVQESLFSSGRRIIVNFGDTDFHYEGSLVSPRNYLTL